MTQTQWETPKSQEFELTWQEGDKKFTLSGTAAIGVVIESSWDTVALDSLFADKILEGKNILVKLTPNPRGQAYRLKVEIDRDAILDRHASNLAFDNRTKASIRTELETMLSEIYPENPWS